MSAMKLLGVALLLILALSMIQPGRGALAWIWRLGLVAVAGLLLGGVAS